MATKIRINVVNPRELLELPGIGEPEIETIVRFRREHGPIVDARQLVAVLGRQVTDATLERADFAPSDDTAPEAPGA